MSAQPQPASDSRIASPRPPPRPLASVPPFTCVRTHGRFGAALVHLTGELDLATAALLGPALRRAQLDTQLVVLDMRELTFMDCVGMHVVIEADERARQAGRRLIVVRGPAQVDMLFTLTGTAERIEISDDEPSEPLTDQGLPRTAPTNGAA